MKLLMMSLAASASLFTVAAPAAAAPWQSINQRQANLNARINEGVRRGGLTRIEAARLRARMGQLNRLEWRYRRTGGLSAWERADLNRRFDSISRSVRVQRHDWQRRR
jgi:hypothetical protein